MSSTNGFQTVISNKDSLALFMRKMKEFDQKFCDLMVSGDDFNIRLEVRGNQGSVLHCRISTDQTDRPKGSDEKER